MIFPDKFEFVLPDGTKRKLTLQQARSFGDHRMNVLCDEIIADMRREEAKRKRKDGFVPGWQANLGLHITCYAQYKRALKDRGLVEIGYDYSFKESAADINILQDAKIVESMVREMKIDLTGQEIAAIENGEYFKD